MGRGKGREILSTVWKLLALVLKARSLGGSVISMAGIGVPEQALGMVCFPR